MEDNNEEKVKVEGKKGLFDEDSEEEGGVVANKNRNDKVTGVKEEKKMEVGAKIKKGLFDADDSDDDDPLAPRK